MPTPVPSLTDRFPLPKQALQVVTKALILFVLANLLFAWVYPLPALGNISIYNRLIPGRNRLPYGDNPAAAYNISLYNLDAMFSAHEIDQAPKPPEEYRVLLIGDSSTWGYLLEPEQTLSAQINKSNLTTQDGRQVVAYNLGYPVMSLMKDLVILDRALQYQPDLIIWLVTLESFPVDKQLFPPLLQNNPKTVSALIRKHQLNLDATDSDLPPRTFYQHTILGARRELANWLRLQLYGLLWAATGIDQDIPDQYTLRLEDLSADDSFHNLTPPHLQASDLALDVLQAGINLAGETPVVVINEPMFISQGENSNIRYNFYYPRWAYDDYRSLLKEASASGGWQYLDLWDIVPPGEFTNTAVHMTANGTTILADRVSETISSIASHHP